jgi:competence protein ComGC
MEKRKKISLKELFIVVLINIILFFLSIPNYKKGDGTSYLNSGLNGCSRAINFLTDAIEMAELKELNELTEENIAFLKENKYIPQDWPFKSSSYRSKVVDRDKCKYHISGNLSKDGIIYCEYQGSINYIEEDGNGCYNHMNYGYQAQNIKKVGNTTYIKNVPDNVKYDINKAKIPPSKEFLKAERDKNIKQFTEKYGFGIVIGVFTILMLFIFS